MGVSVYQDTFSKRSGNGTQTISGLPFQPKAVIFWTATMSGTTILNGYGASYGFSDGTNNEVVGTFANDNTANSSSGSVINNTLCIFTWSPSGGTDGVAAITSLNSDGFTLNWTLSTATTHLIHYMAIGGTDITDVKVGEQTVAKTTTGNKSYTPTTFQPDFLLTANEGFISASPYANGVNQTHLGIGVSAMKSSSARWAVMNVIEGGRANSDSWRYKREDKCFSLLDSTTGSVHGEADFVSFDATGWTWNYTTAGANITNSKYIYLAIKGGLWDVGSSPVGVTGTTTRTINTNATGILKGVGFAFAALITTNNISNSTAILSLGGTDLTRQSVISVSDLSGAATMANVKIQKTDAVVYGTVANATAGSSTIFSVGSLSSSTSTSFTTSWTNIDANAYIWHYFAVSEVAGTLFDRPISETTVSVSETLGRVLASNRTISEPSISSNQTLARVLSAIRTISETTITINDVVNRIQSIIKTISETAITVNQSLTGLRTVPRVISETAITIDQTLARIQAIIKSISEPSISSNDSVARLVQFIRTLPETVGINEALTRIAQIFKTITETAITVNQTLTGIKLADRSITESAINIDDTLARIAQIFRTISEPSITIDDTVEGIKSFLRSIIEPSISVNQTLTRILNAIRSQSEDPLTINDTVARIQSIFKTINETVEIDSTVTGLRLVLRSVAEAPIKWYYSLLTYKTSGGGG